MRTGMHGWHKSINKNFKAVDRSVRLNDDHIIDPSKDVIGKMHRDAKATVLKRKAPIALDLGTTNPMKSQLSLCSGDAFSVHGPDDVASNNAGVALVLLFNPN